MKASPTAPSSFPRTRYQGSKRKVARKILDHLDRLDYDTVLDAFGGTASVAYEFKRAGKKVTYNDLLAFNHQIGVALIENDCTTLTEEEIDAIGHRQDGIAYGNVIAESFADIYYTDAENGWLDIAVANTAAIGCPYKRAMSWYTLAQACMAKRPYNLFHRANLYMRTADVKRSFGNKASWDRPFETHMSRFAAEANAAIVNSHGTCRATQCDAHAIEPTYDLVYIDPPYTNGRGVGVDYGSFYHFLEGMVRYEEWPNRIDWSSKHRKLKLPHNPWSTSGQVAGLFQALFERHRNSIIVVSYRNDGIPSIPDLEAMLKALGCRVRIESFEQRAYALSKRETTREMLLIATPTVR